MCACFDCVIVTASNLNQCELFKLELQLLRDRCEQFPDDNLGLSRNTRILAVSDPLGLRVGSGGATFHAIAEAHQPGKSLLILHSGGDSRRNPLCCVSGKGFATINFAARDGESSCATPLERLLQQVSKLMPEKTGALVCCTDTLMTNLILQPQSTGIAAFTRSEFVTGVGIYTDWEFGTRHGVFYPQSDDEGRFGILQKASEAELRSTPNCVTSEGQVLLDSGLIHLGQAVVEEISLALREDAEFQGLTNEGMDAGLVPSRFELYTDFLQSLDGMMAGGKAELAFSRFSRFPFTVVACAESECEFIHLGTTKEHLDFVTGKWKYSRAGRGIALQYPHWQSYANAAKCSDDNAVLINSIVRGSSVVVAPGALVEHCELGGVCSVGPGAILSQIHAPRGGIAVEADICVQCVLVEEEKLVARFSNWQLRDNGEQLVCYSVFGVRDGVKDAFPRGQYCNQNWSNWPSCITQHLWEGEEEEKSLWNAKLFPVISSKEETGLEMCLFLQTASATKGEVDQVTLQAWRRAFRVSLCDLVWIANAREQFHRNRVALPARILAAQLVRAITLRQAYGLAPAMTASASASDVVLAELDRAQFADDTLNARTMSLMADLLARERSSGNACHPAFAPLLAKLAASEANSAARLEAVAGMAKLRQSAYWREHAARVARHYDMASQLLTGRSLQNTAPAAFRLPAVADFPRNIWVHATAPCRIDLSGGWTDTPPITNESGGRVVNVAVNLHRNEHALGASCQRLVDDGSAPKFVLRYGRHDDDAKANAVVCTKWEDFSDHSNPRSPCALLKSVLLALFPARQDLFQVSLELCVWSRLPAGSGLGGSSILAACALQACAKASGMGVLAREDVCRLVLKVEQLLSTGGGWQDQIGAIYPGFKISLSKPELPIKVEVHSLEVSKDMLSWFEGQGVLVQTGPARLARDLLQVVIRRWHRRERAFCDAIAELQENAQAMSECLLLGGSGGGEGVARELSRYWSLKKQVCGAAQAEPAHVTALFKRVDDMVLCKTLCGAGGGGFAFFLLKPGHTLAALTQVLSEDFPEMRAFPVSVCNRGLCLE